MNKTLALFDFDGTITRKDTFIAFLVFARGWFKVVTAFILFGPLVILFLLRVIDPGKVKLRIFSFLFKGSSQREMEDLGRRFIDRLIELNGFNEDTVKKLNMYIQEKAEVYIVSASLDLWIKFFAEKYSIKYICTEISFEENTFRGNYKTKNCNREQKAIRIKEEVDLRDFRKIVAYGNSSADNQMFGLAHEVHRV